MPFYSDGGEQTGPRQEAASSDPTGDSRTNIDDNFQAVQDFRDQPVIRAEFNAAL